MFYTLALCVLCCSRSIVSAIETPSPIEDFIAAPSNVTVLEGFPALLKCKIRDTIHTCQWFYLKEGLDIMDRKNHPILVKEFRPARERDCSIKFSKTTTIHSGQWLCKGLQVHTRKYIISRPAHMSVLEEKDADSLGNRTSTQDPPDEEEEATGTPFTSEGHILNAEIGEPVLLACYLQTDKTECTWTTPDGDTISKRSKIAISSENDNDEKYELKGASVDGNCSVFIKELQADDEGNWQCSVNKSGEIINGPIVHLHIEGFHKHIEDEEEIEGSPLTAILVVVSIVLLIIIIILIIVIYKRVWGRQTHKQLDSSKESPERGINKYLPSLSSDGEQCLIYDNKGNLSECGSVGLRSQGGSNYTRYLDMSQNNSGDGYVQFPGSSPHDRSSFISRTTTSTMAPGSESGRDSMQSVNPSNYPSWKPPLDRTVSVTSSEHLYEEIPEKFKKIQYEEVDEQPEYANVEEDKEGYMIPIKRTENKPKTPRESPKEKRIIQKELPAPPYSTVGVIPQTQPSPKSQLEPEENYDVPKSSPVLTHGDKSPPLSTNGDKSSNEDIKSSSSLEPPVPERVDSVNDPLSYYDVPTGTPVRSTTPNNI